MDELISYETQTTKITPKKQIFKHVGLLKEDETTNLFILNKPHCSIGKKTYFVRQNYKDVVF